MSTQKQINANRRNAAKSTGPRTVEGKARSSRNGLTHGLTAETLVLPGEEAEHFENLYQGIRETYQPQDNVEEVLVHEIAIHRWRLNRYFRMEVGLFWECYDDGVDQQKRYPYRFAPPAGEAQRQTCRLGKVARACSGDLDRFRSLSRYETTIERGFHRALKALEMHRTTIARRAATTREMNDCEANPICDQVASNQQLVEQLDPGRPVLEPVADPGNIEPPANPGPDRKRLSLLKPQSTDVP